MVENIPFDVRIGHGVSLVWSYDCIQVHTIPTKLPDALKGKEIVNEITDKRRPAEPEDYVAAVRNLLTSMVPHDDFVDGVTVLTHGDQEGSVVWSYTRESKKHHCPVDVMWIPKIPLDVQSAVYYDSLQGKFMKHNMDTGTKVELTGRALTSGCRTMCELLQYRSTTKRAIPFEGNAGDENPASYPLCFLLRPVTPEDPPKKKKEDLAEGNRELTPEHSQ